MSRRFGIYWAPAADHPLWRAGCDWLGRDPESGAAHAVRPHRAAPRRYGFHATLKPPFALRDGRTEADLDDALAAAVRRFQARHGLEQTGSIGPKTLAALNVPVTKRLRQLAASLDRLAAMDFTFG